MLAPIADAVSFGTDDDVQPKIIGIGIMSGTGRVVTPWVKGRGFNKWNIIKRRRSFLPGNPHEYGGA